MRPKEANRATVVRRQERRLDAVAGLLERIARVQNHLAIVPSLDDSPAGGNPGKVIPHALKREIWDAILALQQGDRTDAIMLAHPGAAAQYRELVHLIMSAALGVVPNGCRDRAAVDLGRYATFVRCSLRELAVGGEILDPGCPARPTPGRCGRCPRRSLSPVPPRVFTSADATASAASSTSTSTLLNLHG